VGNPARAVSNAAVKLGGLESSVYPHRQEAGPVSDLETTTDYDLRDLQL